MNTTSALLLGVMFLVPARAQAPVPVDQEPRHRLVYENRHVRVFDVLVPQGDETLYHTHIRDGVGIKLTDARIRDVARGGTPETLEVTGGAVSYTQFATPLTHKVTNIGGTPFHNMFIELLPSAGARPDAASLPHLPGHVLVLENERARVYRLVLAPGAEVEVHTHALRSLSVAVSAGLLSVGIPGQPARTVRFQPGAVQWQEGGTRHSLTNIGTVPFEMVDIEVK